jgi:hypothetical protein
MAKSFMLSLDSARSQKKDRSNPCSILCQANDVENAENVAAEGWSECWSVKYHLVLNEDISSFRAQGFAVDDDNEPAPENIPTASRHWHMMGCIRAWGSEPLDARRVLGVRDVQPTLVSADASMHTVLGFFLHFLPLEYFRTTILDATNETLSDPLTWDEFLRFISILLLFANDSGSATTHVLVK